MKYRYNDNEVYWDYDDTWNDYVFLNEEYGQDIKLRNDEGREAQGEDV